MISVVVNGEQHDLAIKEDETLLHTLRNRLGLTGTKYGCGLGECGACTVLIDGRARLSCMTLTAIVSGEVETVEVLTQRAPELQNMLAFEGGFQCGYCTPGQLMAIYELSSRTTSGPDAGDTTELRNALSGNICRCTGYSGIVRALRRSLPPARDMSTSRSTAPDRTRHGVESTDDDEAVFNEGT